MTEKIDIYALGNIYYRILTGKAPWSRGHSLTNDDKIKVMFSKMSGNIPALPEKILNSNNTADIALVQVMKDCFRFNPIDRPRAAQIVEYLRSVIDNFDE